MTIEANVPSEMTSFALAGAIRAGSLSAVEATEAAIARIDRTDGAINAFTGKSYTRARHEAAVVDAKRARGEVLPPLAGVPYAVKNLFDIEAEVTLAGSIINRTNAPAAQDAFLVARMKDAGAVLLGSLNMDEYAYGFTTENSHYGVTRNPHDLSCVAGGSSGGCAAAVAAGQVGVSLGSDTNGSIRVPASLCGVWGLKPTFGRLSRRGTYPFVHSIDHLGPFADSLESLALTYDVLQGYDQLDPGCHALSVQPVGDLSQGIDGLRIGILGGYFHDHASPPAREVLATAATVLGASDWVEWPDATLGRAGAFIISAAEGGSFHLTDLRARPDDFEPLSVDRFMAGALMPASWYVRAQRFRSVYRDKVNALFTKWDVLLAPTTPVVATGVGSEWININGTQYPTRPSMGLLTQPISFAGCPVVAAPMWPRGTDDLPLGVQIIAAPWREDLALRAAYVLQSTGVAHLKAVRSLYGD